MATPDETLRDRVAARLGEAPSYAEEGIKRSILAVAAGSFGVRSPDVTQPTGYDPQAAALFEAVIESAVLVAYGAAGFDPAAQAVVRDLVLRACRGVLREAQLAALLADLSDQLAEDGLDKRVQMVGRTITRPDHAREVLRIAGLLSAASGGMNANRRATLDKLAREFRLDADAVDSALVEVARSLSD